MSGVWLTFLFAVATIFGLIMLMLLAGGKRHVEEARQAAEEEVQNDIRLRDVVLANDIRDRVADVPDRLPEPDPTGATTKQRRGRRGPV